MSFVELIGFLISMGAFLIIFFGQAVKKRVPAEDQKSKKLQDFLDALKQDMQKDVEGVKAPPKPPVKQPKQQKTVQIPPPAFQESAAMMVQKPLEVVSLNTKSKFTIRSKRDLVLMREVMDYPRAYRPWTFRHF